MSTVTAADITSAAVMSTELLQLAVRLPQWQAKASACNTDTTPTTHTETPTHIETRTHDQRGSTIEKSQFMMMDVLMSKKVLSIEEVK